MPYSGADVKALFEQELKILSPDLIFTIVKTRTRTIACLLN